MPCSLYVLELLASFEKCESPYVEEFKSLVDSYEMRINCHLGEEGRLQRELDREKNFNEGNVVELRNAWKEYDEASLKVKQLENELEEAKKKIQNLGESNNSKNLEIVELVENLDEMECVLTAKSVTQKLVNARNFELETSLKSRDLEIQNLSEKLKELEKQLAGKDDEIMCLNVKNQLHQESENSKTRKIEELKNKLKDLETLSATKLESQRADIESLKYQIRGIQESQRLKIIENHQLEKAIQDSNVKLADKEAELTTVYRNYHNILISENLKDLDVKRTEEKMKEMELKFKGNLEIANENIEDIQRIATELQRKLREVELRLVATNRDLSAEKTKYEALMATCVDQEKLIVQQQIQQNAHKEKLQEKQKLQGEIDELKTKLQEAANALQSGKIKKVRAITALAIESKHLGNCQKELDEAFQKIQKMISILPDEEKEAETENLKQKKMIVKSCGMDYTQSKHDHQEKFKRLEAEAAVNDVLRVYGPALALKLAQAASTATANLDNSGVATTANSSIVIQKKRKRPELEDEEKQEKKKLRGKWSRRNAEKTTKFSMGTYFN